MIAYFDCIGGIAGDMTLGALVDAGMPMEILQVSIDQLHLNGLSVKSEVVKKNGFGATKVNVLANGCGGGRGYYEIRKIIEASDIPMGIQEKSLQIFHRLAEAESRIHRMKIEEVQDLTSLLYLIRKEGLLVNVFLFQVLGIQDLQEP